MSKNNKNNAVIIIPARGGSKRIKNKNILKLGNLTLIEHTILHALSSKLKKNIYISTDSVKIKLICKKYPVKVIDRPKKISNDYSSSEDALIHALDNIPFSPDYVVFLQCTSPFRSENDIDKALKLILEKNADSLLSVSDCKKFIWSKNNNLYKPINYDIQNRKREQDFNNYFEENGSIYICKTKNLKRFKNRLSGKIVTYNMSYWQSIQIDEPHDLKLADWVYSSIFNKKKLNKKDIHKIIFDFDGVFTNNKFSLDSKGSERVVLSRADGLAVKVLKEKKTSMLVLSSEKNEIVKKRCEKLGIQCIFGVDNKLKTLKKHLQEENVNKNNVLYLGNDINDIDCMKFVGYPVAVNDAADSVKKVSKMVLNSSGGNGAVRELVKIITGV